MFLLENWFGFPLLTSKHYLQGVSLTLLGVAGGSGSGKTYLAKNIVELARLVTFFSHGTVLTFFSECGEVSLLQQDMFYTPVPDDVNKTTYNFDLPGWDGGEDFGKDWLLNWIKKDWPHCICKLIATFYCLEFTGSLNRVIRNTPTYFIFSFLSSWLATQ